MSPSDKSRRWEKKGHGIYLPMPEGSKRQAEVPIEGLHPNRSDPAPDLLPLPPEVPRSFQTGIGAISMSLSSSDASSSSSGRQVQGSQVQV